MNTQEKIGLKFGRWEIISFAAIRKGHYYWNCKCECGTERMICWTSLQKGASKSCGCLSAELVSKRQTKDLTGQQFGRWQVLSRAEKVNGEKVIKWLCRCSCDLKTEKLVCGSSLRWGDSQSCGCLQKEISLRICQEYLVPFAKDTSNNNYLGEGVAKIQILFGLYKNRAKRKNIVFSLTKEEFTSIITKDCFYCGSRPFQEITAGNKRDILRYVGVDRIDNSKGYIVGNCNPCCKYCNAAKGDRSLEDFRTWAKDLAENIDINLIPLQS